jgi:hypothetical protein
MTIFHCLGSNQRISPGPRQVFMSRNKASFYGVEFPMPHPTPKLEDHPLVSYAWLLIQYICSYPPYWRPFLQPQPKHTPCRSDNASALTFYFFFFFFSFHWSNSVYITHSVIDIVTFSYQA